MSEIISTSSRLTKYFFLGCQPTRGECQEKKEEEQETQDGRC